jgi:hypothetical protein
MFTAKFFTPRFFAPRYFPEVGGVFVGTGNPGLAAVRVTGAKRAANHEVTQ